MGSTRNVVRNSAAIACALVTAACGLSVLGTSSGVDPAEAGAGIPNADGAPPPQPSSSGGDAGGEGEETADAATSDGASFPCGKDCLGGACVGGQCQPTVFASSESGCRGVTVAGPALFWTRDTAGVAVRKKPLRDGDVSTVVTALMFSGAPEDIASNGTQLFITQRGAGRVYRYEVDGSPTWSVTPYTTPTGIGVAGNVVYWTVQAEDGVSSISVGAQQPSTRPAQNWPSDVFVVDGTMYYACSSGILSAPAATGAPRTTLSDVTRFGLDAGTDLIHNGITVIDSTVYFTVASLGVVASIPITGGKATVIADKQASPIGIAASPTAIFWANNGDGTIMKLAR